MVKVYTRQLFPTFLMLLASIFAYAQVPDPYYPVNNQITGGPSVTFFWNGTEDAQSYTLQYADNAAFNIPATISGLTTKSYTVSAINAGSYYYWRVRAVSPSGTSAWSSTYRVGIFLPNNFANLVFWVSADGSIVKDANNLVSQWNDMSGNNNNVLQPNSTEQPTWIVNGFNGLPAVRFDGTNDYLNGGDILDQGTANRSIFFIGKSNTGNGAYIAKSKSSGTIPLRWGFAYSANSFYAPVWHDASEIDYIYSKPFGRTELVSFSVKRDTVSPYYNTRVYNIDSSGLSGTRFNIQSNSLNFNSTHRLLIGAYNNAADNGQTLPLNGYLSEILIYDAAFPDSVRRIVEKMIMDKYAPPVSLGADVLVIDGFCSTTLKAGTNFVKYAWSNGTTGIVDSNIVAVNAGTYIVTATDIFGRKTVDSVRVIQPDPNFYGTPKYCVRDSVLWNTGLSKAKFTFAWNQGSTDSFIYIKTPGIYKVTVTDLSNCKRISNAITFSADSFSLKINLTVGTDTSLCTGNLLSLSQGSTLVQNYAWSTGATTPAIAVDTPGLYKVTVTNSLGCLGYDSVIVTIRGEGPIPNFSATPACLGAPNLFTDLSTLTPPNVITGWAWNFGDNTTSNQQNPQHVYADTGLHVVSLIVTSDISCSSSPITKSVIVYPLPTAFFNDSLGCINTPLSFTSRSTAVAGSSITGWVWHFGDGDTSILQNPQHSYTQAGQYAVSLTVITARGCMHTFTKTINVVSNAPVPGSVSLLSPVSGSNITTSPIVFSWQPVANAYVYLLEVSTNNAFSNVVFTATTTATSISTATIPPALTQYYWRVKAVNVCNAGGISSVRSFYNISPINMPKLVFWVSGDGPLQKSTSNFVSDWFDRSTANANVFQNNAVKQPRWVDSLPKINYKPAIRFSGNNVLEGGDKLDVRTNDRTIIIVGQMDANNADGTYIAKSYPGQQLHDRYGIARSGGQLFHIFDDVTERSISVGVPYGQFEVVTAQTNRNAREITLQRNYGTVYTNVGITGPSYDMNSAFRFLVGSYNSANDLSELTPLNGYIAEILIFDTLLSADELSAMKVYLNYKYTKPVNLGPDINVAYGYCNRVTLDASDRYINYLWSTGDTSRKLPITVAGTYSVTVTDAFGNVSSDTIAVNIPSLLPPPRLVFCDRDSIVWNVNQGPAYRYSWSTGDTTPSIIIKTGGPITVTIRDTIAAAQGGPCSISATYSFVADSFSVKTTLGPDTTICGGALIGLKNNAQNVVAYSWSTGATTPTIKIENPGIYWLNAMNATGCEASDSINIIVSGRLADAAFTVPNAFCLGDTSYFSNQTTILPPFNVLGYNWSFSSVANDTSSQLNPSHYYSNAGIYTVQLQVRADSNCISKASKTIQVFNKPAAKFSYQIGCAGAPINFSDQSVGVPNDALATWLWEFGDDSISTLRNPGHIYSQPGIYEVRLTIASATGCISIFMDTLEVYPELIIDIAKSHLCFGETTQFTDASPGRSNVGWQWEFGDAIFSTQKNPTHNYTQTGTFLVRLTVKNALGCEATTTDTISIVRPPVANFTYQVACESFNFRLNDASTQAGNDPIVKWHWDFNDGGPRSNAPNPVRTYDTIGTFPVTLYIESANGCPASITKPITIAPAPKASFTFTPNYGAAPLPVTYTNTSVGAISYQWVFEGGGYSEDVNPVHTFYYNDTLSTTLYATGPGGCRDSFTSELVVNIATLDIAVVEIGVENTNNRVRPFATIINQGTRNVDHYYLTSSLGDGSRITERIDTFLASGTAMTYYFRAGYEATEFQANSFLCIQASMPNEEIDDNGLNDRLCKPLENDIRIVPPYPNPTMDIMSFEVLVPRDEVLDISLFDVLGHKLMDLNSGMTAKGTMTFKLNMSGYGKGIYILRIKYIEDEHILKFVVD
ncbi:hypothetical protein BH09BAC1_BH09BAC1_07840 [soil metagenome]